MKGNYLQPKARTLLYALGIWFLMASGAAFAGNRFAYLGGTLSPWFQFQPTTNTDQWVLSPEIGIFIDDYLVIPLAWDLVIEDNDHFFRTGVQVYLYDDRKFLPFTSLQFVYRYLNRNELGWKVAAGVEWNMVNLTKIDNLRMTAQMGIFQTFSKGDIELTTFEPIRIGATWSF